MLAPQRMASHPGQENNFPFGYNPNVIHNIGLPDFMTPGPPTGQPLLNDDENANFNNFLSGFDQTQMQDKNSAQHQFPINHTQHDEWNMPPTFVGSETTMGLLESVHPSELERHAMMYGDGLGTRVPGVHVSPASHIPYGNSGHHGLQDNWSASLFHQLHSAASNNIQPGYSAGWQHQRLHPQNLPLQTPGRGPPMRFGSDAHFQPTGFTGHSLHMTDPELQTLEWLESAPNTQPNTRPNTTPSSPNWSKKRKLDDYHSDRRNGFHPRNNTSRRNQSSSQTKPKMKSNFPPPFDTNPLPSSDPNDSDAEAESDNDPTATNTALPSRSPSPPAPWPSSKARPPKSDKPAPKPTSTSKSRKRRKSTTSQTDSPSRRTKRKQSTRVPLTSEQKKANHTNSEQRRRDATARAYAELYDLVPEVKEMGKTSTMKKLEAVVEKVRKTISNVETLRGQLGIQAGGSVADAAAAQGLDLGMFGDLMGGVGGEGEDEDEGEEDDDDNDEGEDDDNDDDAEGEGEGEGDEGWEGTG